MNDVLQLVLEVLVALGMLVYYCIEGIVRAILPGSLFAKDVKGEKVLITGAGSGLGRLMSVKFAELGCELILWDVNTEGMRQTASMCENKGARAHVYTVDLCNRTSVYEVANKVKQEVGDVDILINNAGIVTGKKIFNCPDELMLKTMDVNINAHFWTVKAFLPSMMERDHGHLVTIASVAGFMGTPGLADYCASKFAAVGFDEALRAELYGMGKHGVHTTVVCPTYINTGMFAGAKFRLDKILPVLDQEYVVSKIVNAVLTNQQLLILPRLLYVIYFLKGLLPIKAGLSMNNLVGGLSSMDNFSGREKTDKKE